MVLIISRGKWEYFPVLPLFWLVGGKKNLFVETNTPEGHINGLGVEIPIYPKWI